jgi:hypothetical protein
MIMEAAFQSLSVSRIFIFFYRIFPVVFCASFAIFAGKDLNYDALNYHSYLPFSLFEGRMEQDFYPAGPQSYLNPVGYSFFYFLIKIFDSSIWVAIFLAISHSSIVYILYLISKNLVVDLIGERSIRAEILSVVSVVLGCCTLMLIQEIGSSFIDIYTASLNLFALYCIISMRARRDVWLVVMAGAAVGVSVAFKSTAVIYAFPLFAAFLVKVGPPAGNFRLILIFCVVALAAYAAIAGFWLYRVYEYTGNPIFPLFNNIFCSDFYYCQSFSQVRFQKESFSDYFLWPALMAMPVTWYYSELIAPDIRFLVLVVASFGLALKERSMTFKPGSSLGLVVVFYLLAFIPWILLLGNGRYAIELFVLVGPLLTLVLYRLMNRRFFVYAILLIAGIQIAAVLVVGKYRWAPVSFGGEWFDFSIPEELKASPHLYVSIDGQSASFVALKVHPESAFINMSGQLTLPFEDALQSRFNFIRSNQSSEIKILTRAYIGDMSDWIDSWVERINLNVERVGLRVENIESCQLISPISKSNSRGDKVDREGYVVCSAIYDEKINESFLHEVAVYDRVFDELMEICGAWFNPKYAVTERDGKDWMRRYAGTELRVSVDKHGVIWVRFPNRILPWSLGSVSSWDQDKLKEELCTYKYPKIYYEAL